MEVSPGWKMKGKVLLQLGPYLSITALIKASPRGWVGFSPSSSFWDRREF